MTSKPLVRRTRATLRSAEFGFFGVVVYTRVHTARRCGQACNAGTVDLRTERLRGFRTSWLVVGIQFSGPKQEAGRNPQACLTKKRDFRKRPSGSQAITAAYQVPTASSP